MFYYPTHYVLFLIYFIVLIYLFVYSFNILFPSCILLDYSESDNTHITRTGRVYQNGRETHNLVNDSHLARFYFCTKFTIKLGVKSTS
ncbi:hypothetical protein HanIR_Chr13g0660641 [Helianthus annuus]|nr:hypothetical protein HanIR_Chr13g0660641 [Helianthus annuus]